MGRHILSLEATDGGDRRQRREDAPVNGSPSSGAARMRQHRKRHRKGVRCFRIRLPVTAIDALVRNGYLGEKDRDDPIAIEMAIDTFFSDALSSSR